MAKRTRLPVAFFGEQEDHGQRSTVAHATRFRSPWHSYRTDSRPMLPAADRERGRFSQESSYVRYRRSSAACCGGDGAADVGAAHRAPAEGQSPGGTRPGGRGGTGPVADGISPEDRAASAYALRRDCRSVSTGDPG